MMMIEEKKIGSWESIKSINQSNAWIWIKIDQHTQPTSWKRRKEKSNFQNEKKNVYGKIPEWHTLVVKELFKEKKLINY